MTTRKLPTILYKMYAFCNNFIAQLFQKTQKTSVPFLHNAAAFPCNPPWTKKNPNDTLCSRENSLQLDEKIKSLAIRLDKSMVLDIQCVLN